MSEVLELALWLGAVVGALWVHGFAAASRERAALGVTLFFDLSLGTLAWVAITRRELWASWMREDAWAEWATFWCFGAAAAVLLLTLRRRAAASPGSWLVLSSLAGTALFCAFVAGEEISWGQRLLALQPPEIFLEQNYQQELNIHNLLTNREVGGFKLDSRYLVALIAVIYGVLAPLLAASLRRTRAGGLASALAPRLLLSPWFAAVALAELSYPVELMGEAAELVLGALFLADGLLRLSETLPAGERIAPALWGLGLAAPILAGVLTAPAVQEVLYGDDEALVARTRAELEQLAAALEAPGVAREKLAEKSRVHKRIYTAVQAGYFEPAVEGWFLDPWSNPYWVLYTREGGAVLYSFGPDRMRDSKTKPAFERGGDDIAVPLELAGMGQLTR